MLKRVIFKNFKNNIKNYLLFFLSNTLAVSLMLIFWGLKYNLGKAIKEEGHVRGRNDFEKISVLELYGDAEEKAERKFEA